MKRYSKENIVIVVPMYKVERTVFEEIALDMLFRILKEYTICFVIPKHLEGKKFGVEEKRYYTESFAEKYFESISGYSQLCMSEEFYQRFKDYEYMLIHQLDAIVFKDKLLDFCNMNYDYIGAPLDDNVWCNYPVGNGGLSLRRISTTLRLVENKERIMANNPRRELFEKQEDNFFAYSGASADIDYKVPNPYLATSFSAQSDAFCGISDIEARGLPFGTHHWPAWNYQYWKPIVEKYGYHLPMLQEVEYIDTLKGDHLNWIRRSLFRYAEKADEKGRQSIAKRLGLNTEETYILRGGGVLAKEIMRMLIILNVTVSRIWDINLTDCEIEGIPVVDKLPLPLNKERIVIATIKYENEIKNELEKNGMTEGIEFICFASTLVNDIPRLFPELEPMRIY